ncbi:transposase [Vibrio splendidus]|uniref:transposase n=1 Tax=Vibrio splendidus TaxID=29497 RepID=UPI000C856EFE|nr:transposase [Vibrio splendidus]
MHIDSDDSHYIRAAVMVDKNTKDDTGVGDICDQISVPVGQVLVDKAYDENTIYDTLERHFPDADIVIPPKESLLYDEQRDHRVRSRAMLEIAAKGQMAWQKKHEYGNVVMENWECSEINEHLVTNSADEVLTIKRWK